MEPELFWGCLSKILHERRACSECHSENFARSELEKGDQIIRRGDELLAEAILIIADLYKDGLLEKPDHYTYNLICVYRICYF